MGIEPCRWRGYCGSWEQGTLLKLRLERAEFKFETAETREAKILDNYCG